MTLRVPFPEARRVNLPQGGWLNVHEQVGKGPPLLLLHGFTDCAESFRLIAPHFAERHLVMPDLLGHGASVQCDINDLADFAIAIEQLVIALDLQNVILVGHSMGSLIALILAKRAKISVAGLVLISGSLLPASPKLAAIVADFAALPSPLPRDHPFLDEWYACTRPVPRSFLDRLRSSCTKMRSKDWMSCLSLLAAADLRSTAQSLKIPSFIVSGDKDTIFAPEHQLNLQKYLRPIKELHLADVGHNPHWEAPAEVAVEIIAFLKMLTQPT